MVRLKAWNAAFKKKLKNCHGEIIQLVAASEETRAWLCDVMPLFDAQGSLVLNLDRWVTIQSAQNCEIPGRCYTFEKE